MAHVVAVVADYTSVPERKLGPVPRTSLKLSIARERVAPMVPVGFVVVLTVAP